MNGNDGIITFHFRFNRVGCSNVVAILFRHAVIIIYVHLIVWARIDFDDAFRFDNLGHMVVHAVHREDRSSSNEQRQFPERGVKVVDDTASLIQVARERIDPLTFGQINAITDVVSLFVGLRVLVDRSHQEVRPIEIFVFCSRSVGIFIRIIQEKGSHQRFAGQCLVGIRIGIRKEFRLDLQVHAVDRRCWFSQSVRIFLIASPAIHVQLHRRECFPLEIAYVYGNILPTEDAIGIGSNVWLTAQSGTDIGRDVETDVFPLTSGLVAGPNTGISLSACPAVHGDDERSSVVPIIRHDFSDICDAVQAEGIAITHPCHIGL